MGAYILGLTGPSGAGKTAVSLLFARHGAHVIDCDILARRAVEQPDVLQRLAACFGRDIMSGGTLNRKLLAARAFCSREATDWLNKITHPVVLRLLEQDIKNANKKGSALIIIDAPTLIESRADALCDSYVAVVAPEELRRERLRERDGLSEDEMHSRINAGHTDEFYTKNAKFVIENSNESCLLELAVAKILALVKAS